MQPKRLLILFVAFINLSCGSAPKLNYCIPGTPDYGCSDGPLPKEQVHGMICTDTRDHESLIRSCKLGIGLPEGLDICVVNPGGDDLSCSDGFVKPAYSWVKGFVCLSESDFDRLLIWCKRK